MNQQENPFASPPESSSRESEDAKKQLRALAGVHVTHWLAWFGSLCCIPMMMYVEESKVQSGEHDYRLGWIFLIPIASVLLLPWFAKARLRLRLTYFFVAIAAVIMTMAGSAVALAMIYGMVGVQ